LITEYFRLREESLDVFSHKREPEFIMATEQFSVLLSRELATDRLVAVLDTIPASDYLKTELLQPLLLSSGSLSDRPDQDGLPLFPDGFYRHLFYPSMRRLVDMANYWKQYIGPEFKLFKNAPRDSWQTLKTAGENPLLIDMLDGEYTDKNWSIPVVRYQEGMRGLYYPGNSDGTSYCGTFFYFEPDSAASLLTTRLVIAKTKVHACRLVGVSEASVYDALEDVGTHDPILRLLARLIPNAEMTSESRLRRFVRILYEGATDTGGFKHSEHYWELFGFEDKVDQLLALAARERGIDTIALRYMTGQKRNVSEILDTRDRKDVFESVWIGREEETLATLTGIK
jgi:hypothetical protein